MFDRRLLQNFDWPLLGATLALCMIGVISIFSASRGYPGDVNYWSKQLVWIAAGAAAGFLVLLVDFRLIGRFSYLFHLMAITSLVVVLFHSEPDAAGQVNRWFKVGPISIQPSEFAKFTTILSIAYYYRDSRRVGDLGVRQLIFPIFLVLVPFVLIVRQPDLGTAMMLLMIFFPIIVMAGLRPRIIFWLGIAGLVFIVLLMVSFEFGYYKVDKELLRTLKREQAQPELLKKVARMEGKSYFFANSLLTEALGEEADLENNPAAELIEEESFTPYISFALRPYQQRRIITFLNPNKDPLGAGYHVIQSKVAIGSGRFLGKGYQQSTQGPLNFLPARHTDFLFAIYAEEWGWMGSLTLIGLFTFIIQRMLSTVIQTRDRYSAFVAMGITSLIASQVLINLGMVVGLLPVVGVPLPFFSYGGSAMITLMISMAIILNIRMRRFLWN